MTNSIATAADIAIAGQLAAGMARVSAAASSKLSAMLARARARRDYRQLLAREDGLLSDMGVTRTDVRRALQECGGRV